MTKTPAPTSTPCILVIDDDEGVRATLEILLAEAGVEVLMANDGNQGLDLFATRRVDLVITDMQMPAMNGRQTIAAIRRRDRRIPIIAMSGGTKNTGDDNPTAADAGADRVIDKPFDFDQLCALVQGLLPARVAAPGVAGPAGKFAADGGG